MAGSVSLSFHRCHLFPVIICLFVYVLVYCPLKVRSQRVKEIKYGAILPGSALITIKRAYIKRLTDTVDSFSKGRPRRLVFNFTNYFQISQKSPVVLLPLSPSPTEILSNLCNHLLSQNVITILYMTNSEIYGSNAASAQYLLQLTGYLGIPVIAWNADNMGLEQRVSESRILQLAPSVKHQSAAMLSVMRRYSWHRFSIVTSRIGGHDDFIRAVRDHVQAISDFKYEIIGIYTIKNRALYGVKEELEDLANSEARVIMLYCSKEEAEQIMAAAKELGLTGKNYVWIVTQSVVGTAPDYAPSEFPPGMLGIHFNTSHAHLLEEIERAITIFGHGLELFVNDAHSVNISLTPNLNCNVSGEMRWNKGDLFFKYLRSVSIKTKYGRPNIEFNLDGTLKYAELEVMNLNNNGKWEKIGIWTRYGLDIKDIVWPGDSPVPPRGVPEKFSLKVTFMEEPPYINLVHPDNVTGECKTSRAVRCRVAPEADLIGVNVSEVYSDPKYFMCCSGFCIDLLQKFANHLGFTYELYRVEDGKWGAENNGTWNGLIAELLNHKADIVVTSIKINSERQAVVDFTVPFLETGIAIVVAKRTGIISPKAFLEPFDTTSWLMILLVSIQVAAFTIFLFEWLSPSGYDMRTKPPRDHKFSLFRTYWLVWAILFGAAVNVDCPRGYTARFMANVWAMFAVVFLAIYTANLAAFMITREEYYDLTGIEDKRLANPRLTEPPFRYGTIPFGNTEVVLKRNKPELFSYMRRFSRPSVAEGIKAVKQGELDAFIYDATVLEYLVGQDNECRLLTVGSWYATTGYGFALPKKSKYLGMFNRQMIELRENGDLERLRDFWLQGVCKQTNNKRKASNPLDVNQFMSAFLLLGGGVLFAIILLCLEHIYFGYFRKPLAKKDTGDCFGLISLSMGKSLSFRGAVYEAQDLLKHHRCKDPICDTQLWKARHQLDMANLEIQQLKNQLNSKGPQRFYSDDFLTPRDMTRNMITTNDPQLVLTPSPRTNVVYKTEIAEIETVL